MDTLEMPEVEDIPNEAVKEDYDLLDGNGIKI